MFELDIQRVKPIPRAVSAADPEALTSIFLDDVNLAIWERELSEEIEGFADEFAETSSEQDYFLIVEGSKPVGNLLPNWATQLTGYNQWQEDLESVVEMYRCLFEPAAVGVRLHVLRSTMCPRFHVDRVPARLLVTYAGRGTEWLPEETLNRTLGSARLPDQTAGEGAVREIPKGAISILKGTAWEGNEDQAVAHRSPDPLSKPRLVLGLDWVA